MSITALRFARRQKGAGVPDAQAEPIPESVFTLVGARPPQYLSAVPAVPLPMVAPVLGHTTLTTTATDITVVGTEGPGTLEPGVAVVDAVSIHACGVGLISGSRRSRAAGATGRPGVICFSRSLRAQYRFSYRRLAPARRAGRLVTTQVVRQYTVSSRLPSLRLA